MEKGKLLELYPEKEREESPAKTMEHVVLPLTAQTVSIGEVNKHHGIGYRRPEPSGVHETGETFM